MKVTTTSRHYELTPALRDYAETKIQHLTTYFDNIVSAHIVFEVEKYRQQVEVTLHMNGKDIVAHGESDDMQTSVDRVAEKLERQIKKHKGKLYDKNGKSSKKSLRTASLVENLASEGDDDAQEVTDEIIPADPIEFPSLTLFEAVEKLKANGREFSIFSNRVTSRLNVLYKREDGSIGVIEA